jgi:hypothetical protein
MNPVNRVNIIKYQRTIEMATKAWIESDNWETPSNAFDRILPLIPKSWVIWDPFYCHGFSASHMRSKGYTVIHDKEDFFTRSPPECDCIITNPPYSKFKDCLPRLIALHKPMYLFLSQQVEESNYWSKNVLQQHVTILSVSATVCCLKNGDRSKGSNRKLRWYGFRHYLPHNLCDGFLRKALYNSLQIQRRPRNPCPKCGIATKRFMTRRKCRNRNCRNIVR